jgi:prepilin-type N-terminal cleavage/methylation domain-containing protein
MKQRQNEGFTMVEIMIVVAIIGLIAVIALPSFVRARTISQGVRVANDLRVFGHAFAMYAMDHGSYPSDSHNDLPSAPDIEQYIKPSVFNATTAFGGRYNWEGPDNYPYAGVSVFASGVSDAELTRIDGVVDDGSLSTGQYRKFANGRYTYVIEE